MAASLARGDLSENDHFQPNQEDEVLCELNAEFGKSKSELIQRFLRDQEELNERFSEYALNSDDGGDDREGNDSNISGCTNCNIPHAKVRAKGLEVFDVLQDLEDRDLQDNLSTASAVNSGSETPSLSDDNAIDRQYDEDLDEEGYDENWNIPCDDLSIDTHSKTGYSPVSKHGPVSYHLGSSNVLRDPVDQQNGHYASPQPMPRRLKKSSVKESDNRIATRKVKKVLVKKNIRPQTVMGVRDVHEDNDLLLDGHSNGDLYDRALPLGPSKGPIYGVNDSINVVSARFRRISWMRGTQDHPEIGRLSISASVHRHLPRYNSPIGRLHSSPPSTVVPRSLSLRSGSDEKRNTHQGQQGHSHNRGSGHTGIRINQSPNLDVKPDLYRSVPGRPDSGSSGKSRLSIDLSPTHVPTSCVAGSPRGGQIMRGVCSNGDRHGRIVMTPSHADGKGNKRPIAVLKLPPLDSNVVNRTIASVDPSGHTQHTLTSPATTKRSSMAAPSAT